MECGQLISCQTREMASSEDKEYKEYDTNSHCITDMDDSCSAYAADWMKPRMIAAAEAAKQAK